MVFRCVNTACSVVRLAPFTSVIVAGWHLCGRWQSSCAKSVVGLVQVCCERDVEQFHFLYVKTAQPRRMSTPNHEEQMDTGSVRGFDSPQPTRDSLNRVAPNAPIRPPLFATSSTLSSEMRETSPSAETAEAHEEAGEQNNEEDREEEPVARKRSRKRRVCESEDEEVTSFNFPESTGSNASSPENFRPPSVSNSKLDEESESESDKESDNSDDSDEFRLCAASKRRVRAKKAKQKQEEPVVPLVAEPYQQECIDQAAAMFKEGAQGLMLDGPTGCGKTFVASTIAKQFSGTVSKEDCCPILAIVPSSGNVIPDQWRTSLLQAGFDRDKVIIYIGSGRDRELKKRSESFISGAFVVITTAQTLLSDTHGMGKKRSGKGAASIFVRSEWRLFISDESQMWINGPPRDEREVDPQKKQWTAFYQTIVRPNVAKGMRSLCISATMIRSGPWDTRAYLEIMGLAGSKKTWHTHLNKSRNGKTKDPEVSRMWKEETMRFVRQIVRLRPPPVPETKIETKVHVPSEAEHQEIINRHAVLQTACSKLLAAMKSYYEAPQNPIAREQFDIARTQFEAKLTMLRRFMLHPGLSDVKRCDPSNPSKKLDVDAEQVFASFPVEKCSKLQKTLDTLTTDLKGSQVLVMTHSADAAILYAYYAQRLHPELKAAFFHGGMTAAKKASTMAAFKRGDVGVLFSTNILGCGCSIDWVNHIMCIDLARSHADEQQRLGRIKRPLAQAQRGITEWFAHYVLVKMKIPDATRPGKTRRVKTIEDWFVEVQNMKKKATLDVFASIEEKTEAEDPDALSSKNCKQTEEDREKSVGTIRLLMEMLSEGIVTPEASAAESKRQTDRKAERLRKRAEEAAADGN